MRDRRPARFTVPWTWAGPSLLVRSPRPTENNSSADAAEDASVLARAYKTQPLCSIKRRGALTDFLERHFEAAKFLRAQLREHLPHLPGMFSEGWSNEIPAARCERNDTNPAVFAALYAADQPLREKAVHGDTDRTWGQIDDRAYRIDRQRPFV